LTSKAEMSFSFKRILWCLSAVGWIAIASQTEAAKPNFLVLLLDDAGWTDVACFGSQIQTPNIDGLADEGMKFTDCHSAAPNCSPSRAGLLTGRTPSRVGIYSYLPAGHVMHLRDDEVTVAELLQANGYRTGHFGKWHLSRLESDQPQPSDQGFDYSLGTDNNASPSHRNPNNFVRNGQAVGEIEGYSCQIVVDETIQWLEESGTDSEDPFFACVWFHEPHTPIASPPELVEKYQRRFPDLTKKQATYFANIHNVDEAIGRLLAKVDQMGISQDTVIFFTSDNGPLNAFSSVGLRGKKSNVWEGGHRVPGIFRWPGKIEAGSECAAPVCGVDYLPTVCEIAGIETPQDRELDGVSLLPLLKGDADELKREKPLYWFFYRLNPSLAIRDGNWSLIANTNDATRPKTHALIAKDMPAIRASEPVAFQLYDLSADLNQRNDVAGTHPEVLQRLQERSRSMHREVMTDGVEWAIPESYGAGKVSKIWE
ncbi:MAG: sulfatase, partial [Rubripirellula sp.]